MALQVAMEPPFIPPLPGRKPPVPTGDALSLLSGVPSLTSGPAISGADASASFSAPFTVGGSAGLPTTTLLILAAIAGLAWVAVKKL